MNSTWPILSFCIWLPIIGGAIVAFLGERAHTARWVALAISILVFVVSIPLFVILGFASANKFRPQPTV